MMRYPLPRRLAQLVFWVLTGCFLPATWADRPNLIFILTDDQRYDTLGVTGDAFVETPHLDQLANDGVLFANASVNSAICTPSRACYFLGQYERRHGINFNSGTAVAPDAWTNSYPVKLREAGYFTGYVGKNHVPVGPRGYQTGIMDGSFDYWYAAHGHLSFYPKKRHEIFHHADTDTQIEIVNEGVQSFLDSPEGFITGAESFLDARPAGQPFALSIALNLPHGAGVRSMEMRPSDPELYRTTYRDRIGEIPLPATYIARDQIKTPKLPADVLYPEFRQTNYNNVDTPAAVRELILRETQTITGIDHFVGAIRETLERLGETDNTIIIFTSDHGLMHGEFGLGGKALNYETCLRVPLIIYDPRQPAAQRGRRSMALTESVDIAPTLLDYAQAEVPATIQGQSLRPLVEGTLGSVRDYSFAENLWSTYFGNPRIESVRTTEWKYIRYFKNDRNLFASATTDTRYRVSPRQMDAYSHWLTSSIRGEEPVYEELFHLASDPRETTNLADRPVYAMKLREMRDACQRLVTFAKGDVEAAPLSLPLAGLTPETNKK